MGTSACISCPPGFYCPSTTSALVYQCAPGTYSTGDASSCEVCPAGYACPSTTQAIENICATGTYSTGGQTECTVCEAGSACNIYGTITTCQPGTFSLAGENTCTSCTAGNYCPYTTLNIQIPCASGTYALAGASECTPCPAGRACSSTSSNTQTICTTGTFSTGSQASCTTCLAGYYCPSTTSNVMTPCAAGYYSNAGASLCIQCPAGSYCPSRSSGPIACNAGSYSDAGATICTLATPGYSVASAGSSSELICGVGYYSTGGSVSCTLCSPGYMCPPGSTEPSPVTAACPMGGHCGDPTVFVPCLPGTYGIITAGISQAHACTNCEPGYLCPSDGTVRSTRVVCPQGGYCPEGSSVITECASGYKSSKTGQTSITTCEPCEAGMYCPNSGTVNGTVCHVHHYCPVGTSSYLSYPCPAGTYNENTGLYSASQCQNCTIGHYCVGGSSPIACDQGTYNPSFAASSSSACLQCEAGYACPLTGMSQMTTPCSAGHYCQPGTINPSINPCPAGTYTDSTSLVAQSGCSQCTAGYTCASGIASSGRVDCVLGSYCPLGTATGNDQPCPAGTYSSTDHLTSASECSTCLPGSYCSGGGTSVDGPCAAGHYCPAGTSTDTQYPCPAGTYSSRTDLFSSAQCTTCEAGYYCEEASTDQEPCPVGTYAANQGTGSSAGCLSCPAGYYCGATTVTPLECGAGFYSDLGDQTCTICPRGTYCSSNTTANSTLVTGGGSWSNSGDLSGRCFNGTICSTPGMSRVPDLLRDACPAGYYCPTAIQYALPCPAGTYSSVTGQDALSDCIPTPAGYYSTSAATEPTNMCNPGYYCPLRSTSPNEVPCPERTYLPEYGGASVADCSICTAGGYCPEGSSNPLVCTKGNYCVTGLSTPLPCLPGTYGNATGLTSVDECTPCDGGSYCDGYGLTSPRGLCEKGMHNNYTIFYLFLLLLMITFYWTVLLGFYCISGSNTSTPHHLVDAASFNLSYAGAICPAGHYCEMGSSLPQACPAGTLNSKIGSDSPNACVACPSGFYCQGTANTQATGKCSPGYYCTGGSSVSTQYESQPGYYAPLGSSNQTACAPGTYSMEHRRAACVSCPIGFYCPVSGMMNYTDFICPPGRYCPLGTENPFHCPAGTFSPKEGNINVTQCTPCTTGNYCELDGLTEVTDPCNAGYYCIIGAMSKVQATATATGGPCTNGHYCQEGTGSPTPCPRGTYMSGFRNNGNRVYNNINYYCDLCPNGYACDGIGLSNYTSVVAAGYWATLGAPTANPVCNNANCTDMYGICPTGSYCVKQSTQPVACSAGTYQDEEGRNYCKVCPSGSYCLHETTTPVACPAGSYCPEGTRFSTEFLCPNGTYSDSLSLKNVSECTQCTPGYYCGSPGLTEPTAKCREGYFCGGGSPVAAPHESGETGFQISYIGETCVESVNTTINDICPPGHYCPVGSDAPVQCPPGTNSSSVGLVNVTDCPACTRGFYCPLNGTVYATRLCLDGFYCPAGTANVGNSTELLCPTGARCPEGSGTPTVCEAGSYQDERGQNYCKVIILYYVYTCTYFLI